MTGEWDELDRDIAAAREATHRVMHRVLVIFAVLVAVFVIAALAIAVTFFEQVLDLNEWHSGRSQRDPRARC